MIDILFNNNGILIIVITMIIIFVNLLNFKDFSGRVSSLKLSFECLQKVLGCPRMLKLEYW